MMLISVNQAECREGMAAVETALREETKREETKREQTRQQAATGFGKVIEPTFPRPQTDRYQVTEPVVAATAALRG